MAAHDKLAPQEIVTFITRVAAEFNSFYTQNQILDGSPEQNYKIAITKSVMQVLKNGMEILGIGVPERM